ncbi:MAG: MaoC family dehydratase [Rubrivivax sp.]|nr:MaoC family dehydratase [Rubrivivax sp.]MDP3610984.1 MaoC family dehydratase [Rubrivivax sp.]
MSAAGARYARLADLAALTGQDIGHSDWVSIDQARIDLFAQATGDHQWIHVDPVRAAAGPFGAPIAHGFLTLSLLPMLFADGFAIDDVRMGVNYGLNRVRFVSPVPVGSRLRGRFKLLAFEPLEGGAQLTVEATIELEGSAKPACVAESVSRRYI